MANTYKYSFIPRNYYPAVMFACKMIRENGFFNKAIERASNYYDVNKQELEKLVRKRQGEGQKGKTCKYKYYVVKYYKMQFDTPTEQPLIIIKATNKKNAEYQITKNDYLGESDYSSVYSIIDNIIEFDTQQLAEQYLKDNK